MFLDGRPDSSSEASIIFDPSVYYRHTFTYCKIPNVCKTVIVKDLILGINEKLFSVSVFV